MSTLKSLSGETAPILRDRNFQFLLIASVFPILYMSPVSPILDSSIEPFGTTPANSG